MRSVTLLLVALFGGRVCEWAGEVRYGEGWFGKMTPALAEKLVQNATAIGGRGNGVFVFEQALVAAPARKVMDAGQKAIEVWPVRLRYAVTCQYGPEEMRAEVAMTADFYRDAFGQWNVYGPDLEGDQSWDNLSNQVRCHVQNLAHLTYDKDGKVLTRVPAKDQTFGFPGCNVVTKAAD